VKPILSSEFASKNREWVDVLIAEGTAAAEPPSSGLKGYFGRERSHILDDGTAICPAGKSMSPPSLRRSSEGCDIWR
jgi:hypothetical protein